MAYKVRCRLVAFLGDIEHFPCHFGYEIGDEFIYDGEKFIGRICPALFSSNMLAVIDTIRYNGNSPFKNYPWTYSGISRREPSMKEYDGIGWANVKESEVPDGARKEFVRMTLPIPAERRGGGGFFCGDPRTLAMFRAEPYGLSDKGFDLPFYKRQMNILEKIKAEPGLSAAEVLERFTDWEREEIYPRLGPVNVAIMMEELEGAGYIELRDGKAYSKSPSG
jgi:uncharacterized repeat protein (TIGR04076 family)